MKLAEMMIYGFGKFYQKHLSFQDGIHVIYGPNEAGKSTLHTFLGCMLFGLERGRGRAARSDLYSRYLPWDHDATYGGALTLETEDHTCRVERSFRSDRRTCQLTIDDHYPCSCTDDTLIHQCLEGLTEPLYYNTISVRSLGCAPDSSLAQELTHQLADLHQTGSDSISYHTAAAWLRNQRKLQESLLTPDLEQQILTKQHHLDQLQDRLQNTSFQERKAALQMDMDDCLEQLTSLSPAEPPSSPARSRHSFVSVLCFLVLAAAALWCWTQQMTAQAMTAGIVALIALLLPALRPGHDRLEYLDREDPDVEDPDAEDISYDDHSDLRSQRLRRRIETLQQQYETVCRQEWDHDHLLEQAQALEEELEQLTLRQSEEDQIRLEIQAISLAASTLQKLSGQMQDHIGPALGQEMSRILEGLTQGSYTRVFVDGQLHVSVQAQTPLNEYSSTRIVPLDSLSRGTIEQVYLAMRLAVIDLLFPQGGMPLILDDCFLTYDDDRLAATLSWLAEHYSGQILIFTCQKREAALLRKEQIPFTHVVL